MIKTCTICGEESRALHMHMKKHSLTNQIINPKIADPNIKADDDFGGSEELTLDQKKKIVDTLIHRIPGLFDRHPQGSISRQGLEKLVDELF